MAASSLAKPQVLILGHCGQLSGAELALCRVLPHVDGVDVHVILGEDGPLEGALTRLGVSVEVLPLPIDLANASRSALTKRLPLGRVAATARYTRQLRGRLRSMRPDLVHTSSAKAHIYGGLAARSMAVPQVWHARDRIARDYLPGLTYAITWLAALLLPSYYIANSESTLRTLPRWRRSRARVLAEAVEIEPESKTARQGRELTIGIVGRLAPWKGQHVFLEAFATAFRGRPDVRAVVVGDALFGEDEYARHLHRLADQLGIRERVQFMGWVENPRPAMRGMDVLVHCSVIPEPFGQVVIEGMAEGLPVIASAGGGPTEIITDGEDGLLTAPGDAEELARVMTRLADDSALRHSLGRNAREAAESYRPQAVAEALTRIYLEILGRNPEM